MQNHKQNPQTTSGFKIIQAGQQPPCLQPDFGGFCRGCFGWQNMVNAALNNEPAWKTTQIHCLDTDLTITLK